MILSTCSQCYLCCLPLSTAIYWQTADNNNDNDDSNDNNSNHNNDNENDNHNTYGCSQ